MPKTNPLTCQKATEWIIILKCNQDTPIGAYLKISVSNSAGSRKMTYNCQCCFYRCSDCLCSYFDVHISSYGTF